MATQTNNKNNIIKCPHCGYEYLSAEIINHSTILDKPDNICRTDEGFIDFFTGDKADFTENYYCDNCGKEFRVDVKIKYSVSKVEELDFDEEFSTVKFK